MADAGGGLTPRPIAAEALLALLPVALLLIDEQGRVTRANAAAETLLNQSRGAIEGQPVVALIGHRLESVPADAPFVAYDLDVVLPGRRHSRVDLSVAPVPERPGWRLLAIHPHATANPIARRTSGTLAAVGVAAMLAHEIKNPLSGIRGAAQLLEAGIDAEARDLTRLIREEVDRVTALIDRMEAFTDARPPALGPHNIHAILGHARDVARAGFARGMTIREVYDPSLPPVAGDRDRLVQVVLNLLKNAAEASQGKGEILITTAYRHGVSMLTDAGERRRPLPIELCVIDHGPGAPDDIAAQLFDPFVSSKPAGGGLGLALVAKLVADHGGLVEYGREGVPPRTVFRVLLPRASGKTA